MKTSLLFIAASLILSAARLHAQGAQFVVVENLGTLETNTQSVITKLNAILEQAEKQNKTLEDQLKRTGDPTKLYEGSFEALKSDIVTSANLLKTNTQRTDMLTNANAADSVFGRSTYGLAAAVDETVTLKDGTPMQRDESKYQLEAKQLADVDEYRRVREEAIQKKKTLTEELDKTITALEGAKDFANIQKYGTLIQVIQGQIASAETAAQQAFTDMEVLDREIKAQASASRKAKAEEKQMEADNNTTNRGESTLADRQKNITDQITSALGKARDYLDAKKANPTKVKPSVQGPSLLWKRNSQNKSATPEEGTGTGTGTDTDTEDTSDM